ncbi:MAG: AMP nucleosidase [Gammaproteobacteria bacterium]|nr:AMP nucleosidase [Gammaproteobacteria bacterium]
MPGSSHGNARDLRAFEDADSALARVEEIYSDAVKRVQERFQRFLEGDRRDGKQDACYPYIGIEVDTANLPDDMRSAWGAVRQPGTYGTTITRPDLFRDYYRQQIDALLQHHGVPVYVGISDRPISLPFVDEATTAEIDPSDKVDMRRLFHGPDLARIDDSIPNGTYEPPPGHPMPLALFTAERVDLALNRIRHYTGTDPGHFQGFVLFTNYQRYVNQFVERARAAVTGGEEYTAFIEPGDVVTRPAGDGETIAEGIPPATLPQMPAYHAVRSDGLGISLVNIGIGPANAKTITDHLAVLRPHCWLMLGHCGGLRRTQRLGDYVLAHAYVREDHVLDQDLPPWIPLPVIAEVQIALQEAVATCTGLRGRDLKTRLRTGTLATTDNRNWELRYKELYTRFSQSRAVAVDMESATIAANGFRLRVPYGTLLCVSDKPMHGELKLRNMANAFYRESVDQHLTIGLETVRILREAGVDQLHSRKLRSIQEPPFL